jgi:hypothetical protein
MPHDHLARNAFWWRCWWRSWWAALLLGSLPYIRAIGINGSLTTGTWTEESDIDWYVVVRPGSIYTMRIVLAVLLQIAGLRRQGSKVRARICLNRIATTNQIEITPHNAYHARVFSSMVFLVSSKTMYEEFIHSNTWMTLYGYHSDSCTLVRSVSLTTRAAQAVMEMLFYPLLLITEPVLRTWQLWRFQTNPAVSDPKSKVRLSDDELCFHLAKSDLPLSR